MQPTLELRGIRKTYGKGAAEFNALKGVDLDVRPGESLAIIGKSGSGKSTLMHVMALLDQPDAGSIKIDGKDVTGLGKKAIDKLRNEQFGFIFQQFFMVPNISVLENVTLPLAIAGVARSERNRRGMQMLEQLDMADKAKNKATALSGGQKQRVVIARALVTSPQVIFADEPTGNLDSATSESVEDIMFNLLREQGITLVVVTHDPDLAARCERQVTVADGLITQGAA